MRRTVGPLAAFWMVLSCGIANAIVITFDDQPAVSIASTFSDSGFQFSYTNISGGFAQFGAPPTCSPACVTNGTQAFYSFNSGSLTMSAGGSAFSLLGLDLAQTFSNLNRDAILNVTGQTSSGHSVATTFTMLPGQADAFQTFTLPDTFGDLFSVTFVGGQSYPESEFALDNLHISPVPVSIAEPAATRSIAEPTTVALLSFALAGLGFSRRRLQ